MNRKVKHSSFRDTCTRGILKFAAQYIYSTTVEEALAEVREEDNIEQEEND